MIEFLKVNGNSKIQESVAEYSFLKDLITDGIRNNKKLLISRSDFDAFGFDILAQIEGEDNPYQIQLKAFNGEAAHWDIHKSLLQNLFGRVIVIEVKEKENDLCFNYYTIDSNRIEEILNTPPKKSHPKKCKLKKGDLVKVKKDNLIEKIMNNTHNSSNRCTTKKSNFLGD